MEPVGEDVCRHLCELSRRAAKEDKGRTEKGRWGLGKQTNEGLSLKGSGQPFKLQGSKGCGFIVSKALD